MNDENGDIIIYQTDDGLTKIDVKVQNETVWLSQQQMAELFNTSRTNVIEHINNIYLEEELDNNSTCIRISDKFEKKEIEMFQEKFPFII